MVSLKTCAPSKNTDHKVPVCAVAEPAEIFNLRADAKIWAYSETKKNSKNINVNGLREVLPWW